MKVQCPGCGWSAEVPDEKVPVGGGLATCQQCKTKFEVKRAVEQDLTFESVIPPPAASTQINTKPCPFCGEEILSVAKKCKHCGSMLDGSNSTKSQSGKPKSEGADKHESFRLSTSESNGNVKNNQFGIGKIALLAVGGVVGILMIAGGAPMGALAFILLFSVPVLLCTYTKLSKLKSAGIGLVIFFILAVIASNGREAKVAQVTDKAVDNVAKVAEPAKPVPEAKIEVIEVYDLANAYNQNTVAADLKYKGKKFGVVGTVENINTDFMGNPYITMSGGVNQFQNPHFEFDKSDSSVIATFKKGDLVKLICIGKGDIAKTPMSGSCRILE